MELKELKSRSLKINLGKKIYKDKILKVKKIMTMTLNFQLKALELWKRFMKGAILLH